VLTFDVEATQTILALKELVQEKEGIAVNQMRLIYKGAQLCVEGSGGRKVGRGWGSRIARRRRHSPTPLAPCARARSNDTVTVEAARIEAGAVINMIIALRGGAGAAAAAAL